MEFILFAVILGSIPFAFLAVIFAAILGVFLPREYSLGGEVVLNAPPSKVWNWIINFESYPTWVPHVTKMDCVDPVSKIWHLFGPRVPVKFQVVREESEKILEMKMLPSGMPMSGCRKFVLEKLPDGNTRLRISQSGEVDSALLRTYLLIFDRKKHPVLNFLDAIESKSQ